MIGTLIGALPGVVVAPITAVLATLDGRFLFAILWACAAVPLGAIVRSACAETDARQRRAIPVVAGTRRIPPRAA